MPLYLIAILPSEEISQQVLEWKEYMRHHFGCKVALKSPAHITLIPPFQLPDDKKPALENFLATQVHKYSSFNIDLKSFAVFAPNVIYVHVEENAALASLKQRLETLLIHEGYQVKKEERAFHPHVTIANRDLEKQDFQKAWEHFKAKRYQASFPAASVTLLRHNGKTWDPVFDALLPEL